MPNDNLYPMLVDPVKFTEALLSQGVNIETLRAGLQALLASCVGFEDRRDPNEFLASIKTALGA